MIEIIVTEDGKETRMPLIEYLPQAVKAMGERETLVYLIYALVDEGILPRRLLCPILKDWSFRVVDDGKQPSSTLEDT